MRVICPSAALAVWFLTVAGTAAPAPKADPREKLETAITEAIRLLEAKDYATVLKHCLTPDDLKAITEKIPLDEFAKQFGEGKADRLLKVLKSIEDVKPTLDKEGKTATFKLKEEADGKKTISWVKIGKYWYIQEK
jgi:hypothetical protein